MDKYRYLYRCHLINKGKTEEDFTISIKGFSKITVLDAIEKILQDEYGWIMRRMYQEDMKNERYWDISLIGMEVLEEKKSQ